MRIAISADFVDPESIGGAGRVLVEVARGLVERGHEVAVVAGAPRERDEEISLGGRRVRWISFVYRTGSSRGLGFYFGTRRAIRRAWARLPFAPDRVLHHQPFAAHAIGPIAAPVTYYFHSPWPLEYLAERFGEGDLLRLAEHGAATRLQVRLRRRIERAALARAERIICLSQSMRRTLLDLHPVAPERTEVHPGGVDLVRFRPLDGAARRAARARFGASTAVLLLAAVRRMIPRTGLDLLLRAIAKAGDELGPFRLVLPGRGPERAALVELAASLGLADRVDFPGYLPDEELPLLYAACDLTVVPTRALEGFGLATLESLACGTPVVATPVGGSVEILAGFDPRLIADSVGHEALAERLRYWSRRSDDLTAIRRGCRRHVVDRYSWDRLTRAAIHANAGILPIPEPTV
jgi:glycosyltransferase involved in cell wall biosynthesis